MEPLKEIQETVQQVKDDAISAIGQIGEDVGALKSEGSAAINDLSETIKGDGPTNSSQK